MGTDAPDISAKLSNGKSVKLSSYEKKKPVVVLFWASWCTPSSTTLKDINKVYADFQKAGIEVLAVSIDKSSSAPARFAKTYKITTPIALDPESKAAANYGAKDIPAIFIVDKAGKVKFYYKDPPKTDKLLKDAKTLK